MAATDTLIARDLTEARQWWDRYGKVTSRIAIALGLIGLAYHYSLLTLARGLGLETPLAYLGLVPPMAFALAVIRRNDADGPPIHDRQLDYIIGIPLLLTAVAINVLLPVRLSTFFWLWRLDLATLPLFAAGVISLVFGVRTLWRLRLPVAFLLLAWPLPYTWAMLRWLSGFTEVTLDGLKLALRFIPVAHTSPSGDGSLFLLGSGTKTFTLSVAAACAGVNGFVGFLLVSAASLAVVRGPRRRKAAWLACGLALIWALNVFRILLIFAGGAAFGETFAIDGLHPVIGLITFNAGVLVMVLLLRRFGLSMTLDRPERAGSAVARSAPLLSAVRAVPRARVSLAIVAAVAVFLASSNSSLQRFDLVASDLGTPRLASFTERPTAPDGWRVYNTASYDWARRYFGESSTWKRLTYVWKQGAASALRSTAPITSDVISSSDLRTFSTYGLEACYRFHNYKLIDVRSVALGNGVVGKALAYHSPKLRSDWTTLYWHWPVRAADGKTRYERVTLMLISTAKTAAAPAPSPGKTGSLGVKIQNVLNRAPAQDAVKMSLTESRKFLASFGSGLIAERPVVAP